MLKKSQKKYSVGQAAILSVFLLVIISAVIISSMYSLAMAEIEISRNLFASQKSYYMSLGGAEDVSYRMVKGLAYNNFEMTTIDGYLVSTLVSVYSGDDMVVAASSTIADIQRPIKIVLTPDDNASFHYGVQIGAGGLTMQNSSKIVGNVYSGGLVEGAGNLIRGEVVSAGLGGEMRDVHATGTVYAHSITDGSIIDKDAYFNNIDGDVTVVGSKHPGSPDQPMVDFPITDSMITDDWEQVAQAGGLATCSDGKYQISSNATLGPIKIPCDLEIANNVVLTLAGPVWVAGSIHLKGVGSDHITIKVLSSLGAKSVALIADNHADRTTSSKVNLENKVTFEGSGSSNSFVMVVSMNNSAELGGSEEAVLAQNNIFGSLLLYVPHGEVEIQQNVSLKEVTAYKVLLKNTSEVIYETGLGSTLFDSGPAGGYGVKKYIEIEI